jgi:hypothetical protein
MNDDLHELLTAAAELRAAGAPWNEVARQLDRSVATCKAWTSRFRAQWNQLYGEALAERFETLGTETLTMLDQLRFDPDKRIAMRAMNLVARYTGVLDKAKRFNEQRTAAPGRNDAIVQTYRNQMDYERDRIDGLRAKQGLPPSTDQEFLDTWRRECWERNHHQEAPVTFDEHGHANEDFHQNEKGEWVDRLKDPSPSPLGGEGRREGSPAPTTESPTDSHAASHTSQTSQNAATATDTNATASEPRLPVTLLLLLAGVFVSGWARSAINTPEKLRANVARNAISPELPGVSRATHAIESIGAMRPISPILGPGKATATPDTASCNTPKKLRANVAHNAISPENLAISRATLAPRTFAPDARSLDEPVAACPILPRLALK